MEFTRHQRLIIHVFKQYRSVPKTIEALGIISGNPYKSPSYVRRVVQLFRASGAGGK